MAECQAEATQAVMGRDFWSEGVTENRKVPATTARYSYEQRLAMRPVAVEEIFAEENIGDTRV
jgi:hypothetical protein